jgi:hypothetical protein
MANRLRHVPHVMTAQCRLGAPCFSRRPEPASPIGEALIIGAGAALAAGDWSIVSVPSADRRRRSWWRVVTLFSRLPAPQGRPTKCVRGTSVEPDGKATPGTPAPGIYRDGRARGTRDCKGDRLPAVRLRSPGSTWIAERGQPVSVRRL